VILGNILGDVIYIIVTQDPPQRQINGTLVLIDRLPLYLPVLHGDTGKSLLEVQIHLGLVILD
jgi:hypothetical protein